MGNQNIWSHVESKHSGRFTHEGKKCNLLVGVVFVTCSQTPFKFAGTLTQIGGWILLTAVPLVLLEKVCKIRVKIWDRVKNSLPVRAGDLTLVR